MACMAFADDNLDDQETKFAVEQFWENPLFEDTDTTKVVGAFTESLEELKRGNKALLLGELRSLSQSITDPEQKRLALPSVIAVAQADGTLTEDEHALAVKLRDMLGASITIPEPDNLRTTSCTNCQREVPYYEGYGYWCDPCQCYTNPDTEAESPWHANACAIRVWVELEELKEKTFDFTKNVVNIGRSENNEISASTRSWSRHHAKLERSGNRLFFADLNSTNGCYLNGERVKSCELSPGDVLRVGKIKVKAWLITEDEVDASALRAADDATTVNAVVDDNDVWEVVDDPIGTIVSKVPQWAALSALDGAHGGGWGPLGAKPRAWRRARSR